MHATEYPFVKIFSVTKPKPNGLDQYYGELTTLGDRLYKILDQGKQWSNEIVSALSKGGGAIFPHTFFSKCGEQMGAVIHAILDSGADQVIMLGTVHPFAQFLQARIKEFNGENISQEPSWGVLNPESANVKNLLKDEFSLNLFKSLLKIKIERRGKKAPRLIERYPSLVNRHPETFPGIQELKELSKNAVIVGTEDYCHHGIAYALPKNSTIPIGEEALSFAKTKLNKDFPFYSKTIMQNFINTECILMLLGILQMLLPQSIIWLVAMPSLKF